MNVKAIVEIQGCDFDTWRSFFDSYEHDRSQFVKNEGITKHSDNLAEVTFEVTDLDGLTKLSQRKDILDFESSNQITVSVEALQNIT